MGAFILAGKGFEPMSWSGGERTRVRDKASRKLAEHETNGSEWPKRKTFAMQESMTKRDTNPTFSAKQKVPTRLGFFRLAK